MLVPYDRHDEQGVSIIDEVFVFWDKRFVLGSTHLRSPLGPLD